MTQEAGRVVGAVERVRAHISTRLGLMVLAWWGSATLAVLAAAPWLAGRAGWAPGSPGPMILVFTLFVAVVAATLWWRTLDRSWGGEQPVARSMDAAANLGDGSVFGSLELARALPPGTSPQLRDAALRSVGEQLGGTPGDLAGGIGVRIQRMMRRGVTSLFAITPVVLLILGLAPHRTLAAWRGMLRPLAVISEPRLPPVTVVPGTTEVPRGAEVDVHVRAPLRESVSLHWEMTGQVVQSSTLTLDDGEGTGTLPPVTAELRYWIQAPDGGRTAIHTLTPVDPLFVSTYVLEVTYPAHTGLGAEEYRNEVPGLVLPAGTHIRVQGQGSRSIGTGEIRDSDGTSVVSLSVQDAQFLGSWTPSRSGTYDWAFTDLTGSEAAVIPEPVRIQLIRDSVPGIAILFPGPDTVLPVDLRQPLIIRTWDDYGIARVEIVARRVTSFGESGEPVTRRLDLSGTRGALARPILDVSGWGVTPGDTIRYFARAVDNHPSGQVGQTAEYVLRVPLLSELERAAQEALDRAAGRMESLAEEASRAEEEARNLQREGEQARERNQSGGRPGNEAEFEEREEISQALERQEALLQAVDSLQRELAGLREALNDAGLADPELRRELKDLEDLLGEMEPGEGRKAADEAREQLSDMSPQEMEELLAKMAADQEQLRRQLEDSIDQFRQAAIDQDFRATNREAEELADQQDVLADAMQEGGDQALRAEQQARLEDRAERLQEQLETLQQRLDQAGEQSAGAGVQEARHQLSQAREQMRQAAQQAQQGDQQSAGSQAQQAAQDLSEVAQELNEAQQQMQQQMAEALQKALGQTATDALSLARRQSELRGEMQGRSAGELADLRGDEAALAQGIRNLAENYALGTQMAAPGSRDLMAAVGQAMESLEATLEAMRGRRGRGPSPMGAAEAVVRSLNEVAMLAITSGEQGQGQGSASASEQMMQQMQQLAQQQGELMNDAASLSPMQLGQETLSEQIEEMAGEQERIAEDLGEMSEEGSQEGDPMGDLEALAAEAQQLAEAMAQGRLDPEVLRRQERLFHRLLDAGRSLERDEDSEDRESEVPGAFARDGIADLTAEAIDALRFRLPGARALRALSPAQRVLVLDYFERLNRSGGRPAPAKPPAP